MSVQISDEAREAARDNFGPPVCGHGVLTLERHEKRIQLAINSATEKLQRENGALHAELLATQAQVEQLREKIQECCSCLDVAKSGHDQCVASQYVHGVLTESLSLTPATALAPIAEILTDIRDTTLDFGSEEKAIKALKLLGVKEEK